MDASCRLYQVNPGLPRSVVMAWCQAWWLRVRGDIFSSFQTGLDPPSPAAPVMGFRGVDFAHVLDQVLLHSLVAAGCLCSTLKLHWSFPQLSGVWSPSYYDHSFSPSVTSLWCESVSSCVIRTVHMYWLSLGRRGLMCRTLIRSWFSSSWIRTISLPYPFITVLLQRTTSPKHKFLKWTVIS